MEDYKNIREKYSVNINELAFSTDFSFVEFNEKEEFMDFIDGLASNDIVFHFIGSFTITILTKNLNTVESWLEY